MAMQIHPSDRSMLDAFLEHLSPQTLAIIEENLVEHPCLLEIGLVGLGAVRDQLRAIDRAMAESGDEDLGSE